LTLFKHYENIPLLKGEYMSYQDVRGEKAIPFYRAFGLAGEYNGEFLAEIRQKENEISISAHAEAEFLTISFKPAVTVLTHTDKDTQTTVVIHKNGRISSCKQAFDYMKGPVGPVTEAHTNNRFSKERVEEIAKAAYQAAKPFLGFQHS
jgi:hypothetical protein